jgi:hypothetical protein
MMEIGHNFLRKDLKTALQKRKAKLSRQINEVPVRSDIFKEFREELNWINEGLKKYTY